MDVHEFDNLDGFIEQALRGEPIHSTPLGFARRVERRLEAVQAAELEKRRFYRCFTAAGLVLFSAVTGLVAMAMMSEVVSEILYNVPGALGYIDYGISVMGMYGPTLLGGGVVIVACILLALLCAEAFRPLRWVHAG